MCNKLDLLFKRNPFKDSYKDGNLCKGYDICFENGNPTNVKFGHFCHWGIQSLFGKVENDMDCYVSIFYHPVDKFEKLKEPNRKLYLIKNGEWAFFYFRNGKPTHLSFHSSDDEKVKKWINFDALLENKKQPFHFLTKINGFKENSEISENMQRRLLLEKLMNRR